MMAIYTALMVATAYGHTEIVELLINIGADINLQDDYAFTKKTFKIE